MHVSGHHVSHKSIGQFTGEIYVREGERGQMKHENVFFGARSPLFGLGQCTTLKVQIHGGVGVELIVATVGSALGIELGVGTLAM